MAVTQIMIITKKYSLSTIGTRLPMPISLSLQWLLVEQELLSSVYWENEASACDANSKYLKCIYHEQEVICFLCHIKGPFL
jgi:hypothetical protein